MIIKEEQDKKEEEEEEKSLIPLIDIKKLQTHLHKEKDPRIKSKKKIEI